MKRNLLIFLLGIGTVMGGFLLRAGLISSFPRFAANPLHNITYLAIGVVAGFSIGGLCEKWHHIGVYALGILLGILCTLFAAA